MLQVYHRVLPSSSTSTLLVRSLIAIVLFVTLGGLEWIRSHILIITSNGLDPILAGRVHDALFSLALTTSAATGRESSSPGAGAAAFAFAFAAKAAPTSRSYKAAKAAPGSAGVPLPTKQARRETGGAVARCCWSGSSPCPTDRFARSSPRT